VLKAGSDNLAVSEKIGHEISGKGFIYGYISAVIQLIIGVAFVWIFGSGEKYGLPSVYGLQIGIAFTGAWQLFFMFKYTNRLLKTRPGPSIPSGENIFVFSLKKLYSTLSRAKELPELFKFLIAWFIFSDSMFTIGSVAILYCQSELGVSQDHLVLAAIIATSFAGIGNYLWNIIQQKLKIPTLQLLILQNCMYAVLPLYGLIGFLTTKGSFGIQAKWEIFPLAMYHGLFAGACQSSCRVLFSELLPAGKESEFFSLYGMYLLNRNHR
jgi:UMF1 family MFS transporter